MKSPSFEYVRPRSLEEALAVFAERQDEALPMSGGQSLTPMLNYRMAAPDLVVDLSAIDALKDIAVTPDFLDIGAAVTHSRIEDADLPGPEGAFLSKVARGIAYRAIRNRGTIGGSVAHADPAADWLTALPALDARVVLASPGGRRELAVDEFVTGAMTTDRAPDEIVVGIRVPRGGSRVFGWRKLMRKIGEFADGLAGVSHSAQRTRFWVGALGDGPLAIDPGCAIGDLRHDGRLADLRAFRELRDQIAAAAPDAAPHKIQMAAVAICDAISDIPGLEEAR